MLDSPAHLPPATRSEITGESVKKFKPLLLVVLSIVGVQIIAHSSNMVCQGFTSAEYRMSEKSYSCS